MLCFLQVSERVTDDGPEVDDGLVEEVAEKIVGVEAVGEHLENCEVAGKVREVVEDVCSAAHDALPEGVAMVAEGIHGPMRDVHAAGEISSQGMPAVKDGADVVKDVVDTFKKRGRRCCYFNRRSRSQSK